MPEVVKRIGEHITLLFAVDANDDGTCYARLDEIRLPLGVAIRAWHWRSTPEGCCRQSTEELQLFDDLDEKYSREIAASDAAREAIERERDDLRREDAEATR